MKINEIFESIQGEGKYIGTPCIFIRLSGCTRNCSFCDTKYHIDGEEMSVESIKNKIDESNLDTIVFTGGEPLLQEEELYELIQLLEGKYTTHLESNGDILPQSPKLFNYIAFSPKEKKVQDNVLSFCYQLVTEIKWDIKIVTDLTLNKNMIDNATMLMPLTTYDKEMDLIIQQNVWKYCTENNINYTPRIHVDVWGIKRKI